MKVICIDNEDGYEFNINVGEVYPVLAESENSYKVLLPNNQEMWFYKERFKIYNPINKLKGIINESSLYQH